MEQGVANFAGMGFADRGQDAMLGRVVVQRPPALFGGAELPALIKATDWGYIDQALPTTVFNKPATLKAFTDTNGNYDGAAGTQKSLVMFDGGLSAQEFVHGLHFARSGATDLVHHADWIYTGGNYGWLGEFFVRLRPITAPYAIATLSWNSFVASPPALGTAFEIATPYFSLAHSNNALTVFDDFTTSAHGSFPHIFYGGTIAVPALVHGFVIDVKALWNGVTFGTKVPAGMFASLGAAVPTFPAGASPYVVRMDA